MIRCHNALQYSIEEYREKLYMEIVKRRREIRRKREGREGGSRRRSSRPPEGCKVSVKLDSWLDASVSMQICNDIMQCEHLGWSCDRIVVARERCV